MNNSISATGQTPYTTQTFNLNATDVCITANTPVEVAAEVLSHLLHTVQTQGNEALKCMAEVLKIKSILKRNFSKIVKYCGFTLSQVNKWIWQYKGTFYLTTVGMINAARTQLERIARYGDKYNQGDVDMVPYFEKAKTQVDLEEALKRLKKEVIDPNKPPKKAKEAARWEVNISGGRKLVLEIHDGAVAQFIAKLYEQLKDKMTLTQILEGLLCFGTKVNTENGSSFINESEISEQIQAVTSDKELLARSIEVVEAAVFEVLPELEVTSENVEQEHNQELNADVVVTELISEPPKGEVENVKDIVDDTVSLTPRPLPLNKDRWKEGWIVGIRVLPKYDMGQGIHYKWTKGEFPVIKEVHGEVGTIQRVILERADGETLETYGNWISDEPTENKDIAYEYYLRKLRMACWELMRVKIDSCTTEDDLRTARLNFSVTCRIKLQDFASDNPEYGEAVYNETANMDRQVEFCLKG